LALAASSGGTRLAELDWSDLAHAGPVVVITALATTLYTRLGFVITMVLLLSVLLVLVERRPVLRAAGFSVVAALLAFGLFGKLLKAPLPSGPLGF
jgi:hypothetical protein